jgi:predicted Zn finger-like uncharacterized protein
MTVRCPRCETVYRRPADLESGAEVRCARCRHVFTVPAGAGEDDGEDFVDDTEGFRFDEEPSERAPRTDPPPPAPAPPREPAPSRSGSAPRFAVRACLFVTLAYAALSLYVYTNPEAAFGVLRMVPLVGGSLGEQHADPAAVELVDVRGEYRRVRGDQLVFIITGKAANRSPVAVQGIQVQGFVTGADTRRQTVFCGAAPNDVNDLSIKELALLQTIEPPREWSLGPGGDTRCQVVFASPPTDLREFGAEVVAVRTPRRRRNGGGLAADAP